MIAATRLFAAVVLAYALSSGTLPVELRLGLGLLACLVAISTLSEGAASVRPPVLVVLVVLLGASALRYYEAVANHHFVLTYTSVLFLVASTGRDDQADTLRWGAARLIGALMGIAFFQKLAAPEYLNGSYFAYLIDIGALGWPGATVCPACEERVAANSETVFAFIANPPRGGERLELVAVVGQSTETVWLIARALAGAVLLMELWLGCVYLWAPTHRSARLTLAIFALGLLLMRAECVFGSLVCVLGIAAEGDEPSWERTAMIVAWCAFMGLLVLTRI